MEGTAAPVGEASREEKEEDSESDESEGGAVTMGWFNDLYLFDPGICTDGFKENWELLVEECFEHFRRIKSRFLFLRFYFSLCLSLFYENEL